MVCDGHGGYLASAKVKDMMVEHLKEQHIDVNGTPKERHKSYAQVMFNAFLEVDKKLHSDVPEFRDGTDFSGTTVNCAFIAEHEVVCANAGDTRCVLSNDQKAIDLSQDHKPNRQDEKER